MVVDASVWVSALVPQDVHHAASLGWLTQQWRRRQDLVAPTLLLPEVGGAVGRRSGSSAHGERAVGRILVAPGLRLVPLDRSIAIEAATAATALAIRGADAVYVAVARRLRLPLVTWDQEIHTRCVGFIDVLYP